jgi:hypothetical protein
MKPDKDLNESVEISHLKNLLLTEKYPDKDYSDRIMREIKRRGEPGHPSMYSTVRVGKRLAFILGIVALLSGFAYAGDEWLGLWDKSGQLVMQVVKTNTDALPAKQLRALDEAAALLAPGESVVVYFGSKEDIEQNRTDQILWTQAPVIFTDWGSFVQALQGPMTQDGISIPVPDSYQFREAGIHYVHQAGESDLPFIFKRSSDGLEYGYSIRQPSSDIQSVVITYQKDNKEFLYSLGADRLKDTAILFDENPKKDAISSINGLDVYYYDNKLFWMEKVGEYSFDYTLSSPTASKQELIEFAKKAIPAH